MNRNLLVIPTYNEAETLPSLIERLLALDLKFDVLIVDDNSPDGTGGVAAEISKREPRVRLMTRPEKSGLATAYIDAFQLGLNEGYDRFFEMDADHSHRPEDLPALFRALDSADVAVGSRYVSGGGVIGWSRWRMLLSRAGSTYARFLTGLPIQDATGGFNGWKRRVLEAISLGNLKSRGYLFQVELKVRSYQQGFRLVEVPILFEERRAGKSKLSLAIAIEAVTGVPFLRKRPVTPQGARSRAFS